MSEGTFPRTGWSNPSRLILCCLPFGIVASNENERNSKYDAGDILFFEMARKVCRRFQMDRIATDFIAIRY